MFTKAGQQRLIFLPLFLLGWLGDNSPSWRHMPSIAHFKKTAYLLSAANYSSNKRVNNGNCFPILASSSVPFSCSLCLLPGVWPGAFRPSLSQKSWTTHLEWTLFCYLYSSLPLGLPPHGGYFYSFVLRKQVQIKFWAHQHFQGPHSSKLGRQTLKSNRSAGHSLDNRPWLTLATEGQRQYEYIFTSYATLRLKNS